MPTAVHSLNTSNVVWFSGQRSIVGDLVSNFAKTFLHKCSAGRLAITSNSVLDLISAAAWLAQTGMDGLVLPAERLTGKMSESLGAHGFDIYDMTQRSWKMARGETVPQKGRISLLTSGTTGEPKIIEHTWETLFTMGKVHSLTAQNWLLTYQPGTYAWYQMLTLLFFVRNQTLSAVNQRDPVSLMIAARGAGVTAISSTPTFWRMAQLHVPESELRGLKLTRITLGGEAVDQSILTQLQRLYPQAELTQIYASTEGGACIVVHDGREGFPAAWLNNNAHSSEEKVEMQIRDGFLWLRSPYAASSCSGWFNSGDRAEIRGNRVHILGRALSSVINVGGAKVSASEVEKILLQHPDILWVRVRSCRAPFAGELVGADIVLRADSPKPSEAELVRFCRDQMPEYMIPRIWTFLDEIPATENLKAMLA